VYLDGFSEAGLGKYLYDALKGEVSVVGMAKSDSKILIRNMKFIGEPAGSPCTLQR
jgi:hypothetical protein